MLLGAAALMLVKKPTATDSPPPRHALAFGLVLAFAIGTYDGFFGPGTGTFLIVGFVALCGKAMTNATADAKVVNFSSNLAAVGAFARDGSVLWQVALPMAIGQLAGGLLGARLAIRGGARLIRAMVLAVSGALVAKLLYDLIA
jgi:uncharacterized membrane protein YfcA